MTIGNFNKLLMLNNLLIEQVNNSTIQPMVPVKPVQAPIKAVRAWKEHEGSLFKEYMFLSIDERNRFVNNLLSYEEEKGHNAKMLINHLNVRIAVTTKDLNKVTELDKEYSRAADLIFKEIKG